jgi:hypothetical protein
MQVEKKETPGKVYLLIGSGGYRSLWNSCVLGAYLTQEAADDAVDAWRGEHEADHYDMREDGEERWEDGWCSCGQGVTTEEVEVSR